MPDRSDMLLDALARLSHVAIELHRPHSESLPVESATHRVAEQLRNVARQLGQARSALLVLRNEVARDGIGGRSADVRELIFRAIRLVLIQEIPEMYAVTEQYSPNVALGWVTSAYRCLRCVSDVLLESTQLLVNHRADAESQPPNRDALQSIQALTRDPVVMRVFREGMSSHVQPIAIRSERVFRALAASTHETLST